MTTTKIFGNLLKRHYLRIVEILIVKAQTRTYLPTSRTEGFHGQLCGKMAVWKRHGGHGLRSHTHDHRPLFHNHMLLNT